MISRMNDPGTLRNLSGAALLAGFGIHYFLHPAALAAQNVADGAFGVLIGISIGSGLLSVRRRQRPCGVEGQR